MANFGLKKSGQVESQKLAELVVFTYARSQNCRFVILSNGNLHYFWDLERGNPYVITSFPTPKSATGYQKTVPDPKRLIAEAVDDDYHVHDLWCDCLNKSRRDIWQTWFKRFGRARIEPVNNRDDVADYCAKYVAKERSWWNVKLLGSRHPQMANFKLSDV